MSDERIPSDFTPVKTAGGSRKVLILLVIAALALAGVLAVKTFQKRQALEETVVGSGQTQTKDKGGLQLPLFAPQPDPAAPGAEAPTAPQASDDAAPQAPSVTMQAAPAEPRTDRVLTRAFVRDLAALMTAGYLPAHSQGNEGNRGVIRLTFKKLNMRYGTELTGLNVNSDEPAKGRREALDHLMSPIVLRLAFDIFSQPLVDELTSQAAAQKRFFQTKKGLAERPLTDAHVREMLSLYAAYVGDVGKAFEAFASRPDLTTALNRYFEASARVNAAYAHYSDREAVGAPQDELDAISAEIKNAIQARESMRQGLLKGIKFGPGSMLAESDMIDIASWIHRRLKADPDAMNAIGAIASLSGEFSGMLAKTTYPTGG